MSYARFGEGGSDVYVYMHVWRHLECCWCRLVADERPFASFKARSTQEMVDHLQEHVDAGDDVPSHVIPELLADDAENFPKEES
ncbi:hypothetical protein ACFWPU_00705 [Streptomyces sp. NPDC058471]|uniref:hypothetical protein n=1 Tax=Streptomyces sp. NPDC058471 TaxID=3346516 RepID=UPI0036607675